MFTYKYRENEIKYLVIDSGSHEKSGFQFLAHIFFFQLDFLKGEGPIWLNIIKVHFNTFVSDGVTTEDFCHILKNIWISSTLSAVISAFFSLFPMCELFMSKCPGLTCALWQEAALLWKILPLLACPFFDTPNVVPSEVLGSGNPDGVSHPPREHLTRFGSPTCPRGECLSSYMLTVFSHAVLILIR